MTVIAAGLGSTLGMAQETTFNTLVTVDRWLPFLNDSLKGEKKIVESEALYGGALQLASLRAVTGFDAKGKWTFELMDRLIGILLANALGDNSPTKTGASAPFTYAYTLGNTTGLSFTAQSGRPTTAGTIEPFTYGGCKIVDWELSCSVGQIAKLSCTIDAASEATGTAYATPSFVAANSLNFTQGALLIGGSAPVGIVHNASIKGTWVLATDRFQIGSTTKSEQLINGWLKFEADMEVEFANLTDFYNLYTADTDTTVSLAFNTPAGSGATGLTLAFTNAFVDEGPPDVPGPQVLVQKIKMTGLAPSGGGGVTATYVTNDATP